MPGLLLVQAGIRQCTLQGAGVTSRLIYVSTHFNTIGGKAMKVDAFCCSSTVNMLLIIQTVCPPLDNQRLPRVDIQVYTRV